MAKLLAFLFYPALELYLLVKVGAAVGALNMVLWVFASALLGVWAMQTQGQSIMNRVMSEVSQGRAPQEAMLNGMLLFIAGVLLVVAVGVLFSPLPEVRAAEANAEGAAGGADKRSIFQFPHLWLGVLCLFLYVGAEVMAGDAIGAYGNGFGLPLDSTKLFTAWTLTAMLVGYLVGLVLIPRFVSQERWLAVSAALGVAFCIGAYVTRDYVSVGFVAALGFANAMMWPAIFPLAIRGLGAHTQLGSALLVMGIAGGAIIPQAFAVLKQYADFQWVFAGLMVPCYLYILYYAQRGHRAGLPGGRAGAG